MPRFIVMEAASATPSSWKWRGGPRGYRKIAVVEVTDEYAQTGERPKMISERAKGVVRIVKVWDRLFQGTTLRCEYGRAVVQAWALADKLNADPHCVWCGVPVLETERECPACAKIDLNEKTAGKPAA